MRDGKLLGMADMDSLLEAHVRFELDQWSGGNLELTVADEVTALMAWLESVQLNEVVSAELIDGLVQRHVCGAEITDEAAATVIAAIRSAHAAALEDKTQVGKLVPRKVYDGLAETVIGMTEVRQAVTDQITTSEVYSRLISHVLYQGIKNYLLTESVIARKVPGASSLMKLGQSALNTAAPRLEKSIDQKLTAFVNNNIQDNIRESQRYLDSVLDDKLMKAVAAEVWDSNSKSTIADAAGLVSVDSIERIATSALAAFEHIRSTPAFRDLMSQVVSDLLASYGDRSIASLLTDGGLTADTIVSVVTDGITPIADRAVADGYLEQRLRARLSQFYATVDTIDLTKPAAKRAARSSAT